MARKRTSVFEDIMVTVSKAPWWVGIGLTVFSYLVLHAIASRPVMMPATVGPGQVGEAVSKSVITTLAMFGQYLFPAVFTLGAITSAINSARRKRLYGKVAKHSDVSVLNQMSWDDFEQLVGEYFLRIGYKVTRAGGNGPDGGVDLMLRKGSETHLVQCKQWRAHKVGVQPVREFYGVMTAHGATGGYFISSGQYTAEAKAFVRGLNLELVDGQKLKQMIAVARRSPEAPVVVPESGQAAVPPACPKCGIEMTKRIAKRGTHAGEEFWGCRDFPRCTGSRSL
jgi:restriction system protein